MLMPDALVQGFRAGPEADHEGVAAPVQGQFDPLSGPPAVEQVRPGQDQRRPEPERRQVVERQKQRQEQEQEGFRGKHHRATPADREKERQESWRRRG